MLRLIKTYDLDGFISDDILAPPKWMPVRDDSSTNGPKKIENEDYKAWKRSDTLLGSWILGTLSEDLLPYVVSLETAKAIWIALQRMSSQEEGISELDTALRQYPYPSEVNVGNFVPIKLSRANYSTWKTLMLQLIKTYGLVGFTDDHIHAPSKWITVSDESSANGTKEIKNQDYETWKKSDALLRSWILGALEEDLLPYVVHLQTAKDVWKQLQDMFSYRQEYKEIEAGENLSKYLPLYKASIAGDWKSASNFLKQQPDALRAATTVISETPLVVAVLSSREIDFVKKLVELMSPALGDYYKQTALHTVAAGGNIEAAKVLVSKNPHLPNVWDDERMTPIHIAANWGQREMVLYLLNVTKEDAEPRPFEGEPGVRFVRDLIIIGLYDIALSLVQRYPKLACVEPSLLRTIALGRSAFPSGTCLNSWQRLIYSCVPAKLENFASNGRGDIENCVTGFIPMRQKLHAVFWKCIEMLVPHYIKDIQCTKLGHHQALQLVKHLCMKVAKLDESEAVKILGEALRLAACVGIHEVVEEIFGSFPSAVRIENKMKETVFHVAIVNRQEKVFNLIYQFKKELRPTFVMDLDVSGNTCLHLAGCFKSEQKLNIRASAAGAALQMQRELQWFKEVERFTPARGKEHRNNKGKTPKMVFTETHEELVKEGEKWMKDTANSCTIVAALIATVVFAAAITVPCGNSNNNGLPIFSNETAFNIFAISDAIALFSSTSSVLMFLSILTERYSGEDFLYVLPKRLIIGLVTLFLSIVSMMIAFGTTFYLVFGVNKPWILIPVVALASVPVTLFAFLQFPLLLDMIKSTYRRSIFHKQSDRIF